MKPGLPMDLIVKTTENPKHFVSVRYFTLAFSFMSSHCEMVDDLAEKAFEEEYFFKQI